MDKIKLVEGLLLKNNLPVFGVGDTVKVSIKIPEGDKVRIHPFEGVVIEKRGEGVSTTCTLRKISFGEGVERTFSLHSPMIDSIAILKKGKVKRARLFYLRGKMGKAAKIEEVKVEHKSSIT